MYACVVLESASGNHLGAYHKLRNGKPAEVHDSGRKAELWVGKIYKLF